MRLAKRSHGSRLEMNMTPMIDVTFLLLIFFMTVNQVSNINREQIPLPPLAGTQDQSEGGVTINIDRAGQIIVSAQRVSLGELAGLLGQQLAHQDAATLTVVIRAHRDGDCRTVNEVVRLLNKLEITRVRMAVEVPS
jgi:biopolymer transport protein ExbD